MQLPVKFLVTALLVTLFTHAAHISIQTLSGEIDYIASKKQSDFNSRSSVVKALARNEARAEYLNRLAEIERDFGRSMHSRLLYMELIRQRPGWPFVWTSLANLHASTKSPDIEEFELAFTRSVDLGRYSHYLIWERAKTAFLMLERDLPSPLKKVLIGELSRSLNARGWKTLGYAFIHKREKILCNSFPENEDLQVWCGGMATYRQTCGASKISDIKKRNFCIRTRKYWSAKYRSNIF